MADSPGYPAPDGDETAESGPQPGRQSPPRTPRWVLVLGAVAIILILAVTLQLIFGIQHGPGLHGT